MRVFESRVESVDEHTKQAVIIDEFGAEQTVRGRRVSNRSRSTLVNRSTTHYYSNHGTVQPSTDRSDSQYISFLRDTVCLDCVFIARLPSLTIDRAGGESNAIRLSVCFHYFWTNWFLHWLFARICVVTIVRRASALHPSRVANSSTSFGWDNGRNVSSAGLQVTLCDPVWRVSSVAVWQPCELLYTCYLLTQGYRSRSKINTKMCATLHECDILCWLIRGRRSRFPSWRHRLRASAAKCAAAWRSRG